MTERSAIQDAIRRGKAEVGQIDSATRQRLILRYATSRNTIEAELRFVVAQIADIEAGIFVNPSGRYTEQGRRWRRTYLNQLLTSVNAEYARLAPQAAGDVAQGQRQASLAATQSVAGMGLAGSVAGGLNVSAVEALVAATAPGSPLVRVFARFGPDVADAIERGIIDGVIRGKGADAIVRGIMRDIDARAVPRWKLAQITRTESMRAFRGSLFESYDALGVEEWEWQAALSARTCLACLAMHGRRFPIARQFMESHPGCRCTPLPVTGSRRRMTGDAWFRKQPERVQRERLGMAYDLYASGAIDLSAFVARRQSSVWGPSITERSATDVMRRAA